MHSIGQTPFAGELVEMGRERDRRAGRSGSGTSDQAASSNSAVERRPSAERGNQPALAVETVLDVFRTVPWAPTSAVRGRDRGRQIALSQPRKPIDIARERALVGGHEHAALAEHGVTGEAHPVRDESEVVGSVAGRVDGLEGPEAGAPAKLDVGRRPAGRQRRWEALAQRRRGLAMVDVVVGERDPPETAARRQRGEQRVMCSASAGPGSTTQAGSRPTTQVFVPDSVSGPGLGARRRNTPGVPGARRRRSWGPPLRR